MSLILWIQKYLVLLHKNWHSPIYKIDNKRGVMPIIL